MKVKTIKKVLKIKIDDWLNSITDENTRNLATKNVIVTGGSIASMLLKEKVNDFDVYFKNKESALAVAKYYVGIFNQTKSESAQVIDGATSLGEEYKINPDRIKIRVESKGVAGVSTDEPFESVIDHLDDVDPKALGTDQDVLKYQPVFLSSNAITLTGRIQIIIRFYGEADQLHENYDFVHCMNYYEHDGNNLVLKPEALECILSKELRYVGSKYPLCSIIRTRKFLTRGFTINAGQYLKMAFQVNELDLTNIDVLEDQLIGVDSAYFGMLIDALKSKCESDSTFTIEGSYVASIIDKIF